MDDLDGLDFEPEYDPLQDPDVYVLMRQGRVEATLTDADLQGLMHVLSKAQRQERERKKRAPKRGPAAALSFGLGSPAGSFALVDLLALKIRGVCDRLVERQGLGPAREEFRRLFEGE